MWRGGRRHISDALRRVLSSYIEIHDDMVCTDKVDFFISNYPCYHYYQVIFSCDQAALWMVQSVRPFICLWHLFHYVPIIVLSWNFLPITVHTKGQGQRSKVKVVEVKTQLSRFRTITPVWIHVWRWNYAKSLMMLRRGALLFFKVIRQISRSHG